MYTLLLRLLFHQKVLSLQVVKSGVIVDFNGYTSGGDIVSNTSHLLINITEVLFIKDIRGPEPRSEDPPGDSSGNPS
jgi:hypothetical protein